MAVSAALSFGQEGSPVAEIKTVYLLPMTYSLDQFLAMRLTKAGIIQVVTDPNLADAVFSDQIGAAFEQKLNALYSPPKTGEPKDDKDSKDQPAFASQAGAGRSKGSVFLVDRRTRNVIWSDYVRPKSGQAEDLTRAADKIAAQLEKDRKLKKDK